VTIAPTLPPITALTVIITPRLLHQLGAGDPETWSPIIAAACSAHGIDTPRRIAAFLANVMAETSGMGQLVESLNYSPDGLLRTWPNRFTTANAFALGRTANKPADQRGIAEIAYGGRLGNGPPGSGDGWKFRGRGLIQLTGRDNYARFARRIGANVDTLPENLSERNAAAESAAHFWEVAECNEDADRGDIDSVRFTVNGGTMGLEKVRAIYRKSCGLLAIS
jgi:putative chitinase